MKNQTGSSGRSATVGPLVRESTPSLIAARIRELIVTGAVAPGSPMGDAQLAIQFGVSRGPVREALQRLIQEGLLRSEVNRGVFVAGVGSSEVADVYLARGAIERAAVAVLVRDATPADLEELRSALDRLAEAHGDQRWDVVEELDLAFHQTLVRLSGSKRLDRMFETLLAESRMLMFQEAVYPEFGGNNLDHEAVVAALVARDAGAVGRAVDMHMDQAIANLTRLRHGANSPPSAAAQGTGVVDTREEPDAK